MQMKLFHLLLTRPKVNQYDQDIPQSLTADQPKAPRQKKGA